VRGARRNPRPYRDHLALLAWVRSLLNAKEEGRRFLYGLSLIVSGRRLTSAERLRSQFLRHLGQRRSTTVMHAMWRDGTYYIGDHDMSEADAAIWMKEKLARVNYARS
jgi:hypothetical protein